MEDKRDDLEESSEKVTSEDEEIYVLEDDEETTYESVLEEAEASVREEESDATGLAPADTSDQESRLMAENQELKDRYLRILADHENFKRRTEKERIEAWGMAAGEIIREILPVLDNFERAIQSGRAHRADSEMLSGIEMIYEQLLDVLRRQGVTVLGDVGGAFDPQIHEGVQREENPDVPSHTVIEVLQKGYSLKGRLIRPAMVKVAVGGRENHSETSSETGEQQGEEE